jgi:hypothetical protein
MFGLFITPFAKLLGFLWSLPAHIPSPPSPAYQNLLIRISILFRADLGQGIDFLRSLRQG